MAFFVPPEILRIIVHEILDEYPSSTISQEPGISKKPPWSLVHSLSMTSKAYRSVVLELWFRTLFLKSPSDILHIRSTLPEIPTTWTRRLHCVQADTSSISVWDISDFLRLNAIRLDWLSRTLIPYWNSPEDPPERIPFVNASSPTIDFDIRGLSWPSPHAFKLVSHTLQHLKIFRMRQRRIWCGLCHTCCEPRFRSPGPNKIIYTDGFGLPMHYAQALFTLGHLEEVYITVSDGGDGKTLLTDDSNSYMWAGECDRCMEIMYEDDTFREKWLDRKRGVRTGENADESIYIPPPSLKRVEWNFLKSIPVEAELSEVESDGEDSVHEAESDISTENSETSDTEEA